MATTGQTRTPYRETKRLKAHERNAIILDAAKSILIKEGYSKFSLRYTAERSGVRLATLQYYFPTKELLFRAAFEDAMDTERSRINRLMTRAGTSPESILKARISGHYKANLHDETASFFCLLWARARRDAFAAELMDEFYDRNIGIVADLIEKANAAITKPEAKRRASFVIATLEGMMVLADVEKRCPSRSASTEKYVVDALMRFIARP